ncbi:MAG: VCBS repeat-containing protein [Planctomycetes bacterium]|nr:VCBS repeat-containing protein [Planctomycetota bacterium]
MQAGQIDPLTLLGGADETPAVVFSLPELPFEEHSEGLPTTGTWRGYPLLHDFTHDGLADIVVSNREEDGYNAWEAQKKGPWIRRIEGLVPRDMAYGPARAADMNEDGHDDLILSAHTDALHVYFNDGKMNWTRSPAEVENPFLLLDVAVGNLNGDAHKDVVGIAHFEGGVAVYLGDGQGGFTRLKESASILSRERMGKVIELADMDGDGIDDIVVTSNAGLKVFLTRKGDPMSWEDVSRGLPNPSIGNSITAARVARFVDGGWPQVVMTLLADPGDVGEDRNGIGVYQWNPDHKEWSHIDTGLTRAWTYRDVAVGDLDKDGKPDLVAMTPDAGGVVYKGLGGGAFKAIGRLAGVHGKCTATLGDVDGDGFLDVFVSTGADKGKPNAGSLRVLLNRPAVWK